MILIDVRTRDEYDSGHIEGSVNYDIMEMMQGIFPAIDKNEEVYLYCESGNRSMMAKNLMENFGFTNIIDKGSIDNLR